MILVSHFISQCSHYFIHGGWFTDNEHVLSRMDTIRHIPGTIVQGRYDVVTPMKTAWELHKASGRLLKGSHETPPTLSNKLVPPCSRGCGLQASINSFEGHDISAMRRYSSVGVARGGVPHCSRCRPLLLGARHPIKAAGSYQ